MSLRRPADAYDRSFTGTIMGILKACLTSRYGKCILFSILIMASVIYLPFFVLNFLRNPNMLTTTTEEFWRQSKIRRPQNHTYYAANNPTTKVIIFPKMVHQTWKSKSLPFHETLRWRDACLSMNTDYEFKMFDDDDIQALTAKYYPQYMQLLKSLHGLYMADMARMIITYHFGGIYMDLDFYCHRPLACLEDYLIHYLETSLPSSLVTARNIYHRNAHILAVPRELLLHAEYLHGCQRVVIQDFFIATPQHPLLRWILDDLNDRFIANNYSLPNGKGPLSFKIDHLLDAYYQREGLTRIRDRNNGSMIAYSHDACMALSSAGGDSETATVGVDSSSLVGNNNPRNNNHNNNHHRHNSSHHSNNNSNNNNLAIAGSNQTAVATGGLAGPHTGPIKGRHRRHDRRHHRQLATGKAAATAAGPPPPPCQYIIELNEHLLHPLVDNSNAHLFDACNDPNYEHNSRCRETDNELSLSSGAVGMTRKTFLFKSCQRLKKGEFLDARKETILVHMWTHSPLEWSFLRGWYYSGTYMNVERALPPTKECPKW